LDNQLGVNMIQIILWFLKRPRLYPELVRNIKKRIFHSPVNRKQTQQLSAEKYCEDNAVSTEEAIYRLTGLGKYQSVMNKYSKIIIEAEKIMQKCPVRMGRGANLELLYQFVNYLEATRVIETGVGYGWSSLIILLSLQDREGSMLYSTDMPYIGRNNDKWVGCIVPESLHKYWKIIKYADREAVPMAIKKLHNVDFCHYDSDKTYEGRIWAYTKLWSVLRQGGILVSDDVNDNNGFLDFCRSVNKEPIIVKKSYEDRVTYQGIIQK
jgi:hypothetical protein